MGTVFEAIVQLAAVFLFTFFLLKNAGMTAVARRNGTRLPKLYYRYAFAGYASIFFTILIFTINSDISSGHLNDLRLQNLFVQRQLIYLLLTPVAMYLHWRINKKSRDELRPINIKEFLTAYLFIAVLFLWMGYPVIVLYFKKKLLS